MDSPIKSIYAQIVPPLNNSNFQLTFLAVPAAGFRYLIKSVNMTALWNVAATTLWHGRWLTTPGNSIIATCGSIGADGPKSGFFEDAGLLLPASQGLACNMIVNAGGGTSIYDCWVNYTEVKIT